MEKVEYNSTLRTDLLKLDPKMLVIEEGFNTRIDFGDLSELKNSIIENGVLVPLRGFKKGDNYVITEGHRRLTAVMQAINEGHEILRVPFMSEKVTSSEERTFQILLCNSGKPLNPLELAFTYKRLENYGYTAQEIAKKIGKSLTHVKDTLLLATASKKTVNLIKENKVSASVVRDLLINNSADETEKKISEVVEKVETTKNRPVKSSDTRKHLIQKKETAKTFTKEEVEQLLKKQIESIAEQFPENYLQIKACETIIF